MKLMEVTKCILLLIGMSGCAKNGLIKYNELVESKKITTKSYADALVGGRILPLPNLSNMGFFNGPDYLFEIDENDLVFDHLLFKGNYKVFYFEADKGDDFFIRIESLLHDIPFAFDARYMQPWTTVVDGNGSIIPHEISEYSTQFGGVSYKIKGPIEKTGRYFLLVGADNRKVGEAAGSMGIYSKCMDDICVIPDIDTGFTRTSTYNPFGKLRLVFGVNVKPCENFTFCL